MTSNLPWLPISALASDTRIALLFFSEEALETPADERSRWDVGRRTEMGWFIEDSQGGYTVALDSPSHFIALTDDAVPR